MFSEYKVIVFDLGGTLMEYKGMPHNWSGYYKQGFEQVIAANDLELTQEDIEESIEILKLYNPRFTGREIEIDPEEMFEKIKKKWVSKDKNITNDYIDRCDNNHSLDKYVEEYNNASRKSTDYLAGHNNTKAIYKIKIQKIIEDFFAGIKLQPEIYDYTRNLIKKCKDEGCKVACFTDLPSAFPEYMFKRDIAEIIELFDLYVSSKTCGYRKPNKAGIEYIASKFGIDVKQILFVGDEEKDYNTARNSNCDFMFISDFKDRLNI